MRRGGLFGYGMLERCCVVTREVIMIVAKGGHGIDPCQRGKKYLTHCNLFIREFHNF